MAIEVRVCICGCGKSKLGTARLKFFSDACKQRYFRAKNKQPESDCVVSNKGVSDE